jgi:hypothetical protein
MALLLVCCPSDRSWLSSGPASFPRLATLYGLGERLAVDKALPILCYCYPLPIPLRVHFWQSMAVVH